MTGILADEKKKLEKLQDRKLVLKIIEEIQKNGIIGEENTIMVLIIKIMLRLTESDPTSSNVIVSDDTGAGKDYIVKKTCKILIPKEKYHHRTDISDKTFDYWKPILKRHKDKDGKNRVDYDTWDTHVIHLEDPRREAVNGQSFKVMSSGGTSVTKVIDHRAVTIQIEGKPVMIVTSLHTLIETEGLRRWDALRIDTTREQTKAINKFKLLKASNKITTEPDNLLIEALQKNLFKKKVIIPFAEELFNLIPENIITRTQTDKLLDYIRASAVLHQHQREKIDNNTIKADYFDLTYGWYVFSILNSNYGIPTNKDEEELIKILMEEKRPLSIKELSTLYKRHSKQWFYNNREKLVSKGVIRTSYLYNEEANKDIEVIEPGFNTSLVLKGFNEVLKCTDKEGFNGFNGFKDICVYIDNKRINKSLKAIYTHIFCENRENHENLSNKGLLKPLENHVKTKSLKEKIAELKVYIDKVKGNSLKVTYENLCFNFNQSFIEKCKEQGILKNDPKGGYYLEEKD